MSINWNKSLRLVGFDDTTVNSDDEDLSEESGDYPDIPDPDSPMEDMTTTASSTAMQSQSTVKVNVNQIARENKDLNSGAKSYKFILPNLFFCFLFLISLN